MIDVERTIISQYANSATIVQLVKNMNEYVDPRADFGAFFDYVWNVESAQGFGLDIWGKIVGINSRTVQVTADTKYFGFETGVDDTYPFNEGVFYEGEDDLDLYRLSDTAFRTAILVKAMANISRCTAPAINAILQNLFRGRGACYAVDLGAMQMRYVFRFYLTPWEAAIIDQMGILPRPAGVELLSKLVVTSSFFGFDEMGGDATPFDESPFYEV